MAEVRDVWQCIGCGRIVDERPCVGICQDRKVGIVYAAEHEALEARVRDLEVFLRRLAATEPRAGRFPEAWRAMQQEARRLLSRG